MKNIKWTQQIVFMYFYKCNGNKNKNNRDNIWNQKKRLEVELDEQWDGKEEYDNKRLKIIKVYYMHIGNIKMKPVSIQN